MPAFTYTRDIPDPDNDPSVDQPGLTVNTNSSDDIWDVDHYGFNDPDGGLHRYVRFTTQSSPTLVNNSTGALYLASFQGILVPHFKNASLDFPLTGPVVTGQNGSAYLAQNILWQWGIVATTAATTQTVTFSPAFDVRS